MNQVNAVVRWICGIGLVIIFLVILARSAGAAANRGVRNKLI